MLAFMFNRSKVNDAVAIARLTFNTLYNLLKRKFYFKNYDMRMTALILTSFDERFIVTAGRH